MERALALGERVLDAGAVARLLGPRRRPMSQWLADPAAAIAGDRGAAPPPARSSELAGRLLADAQGLGPVALKALLAEAEAMLIADALARSGGTIAASARMLGLKRTTLTEKMKRMGLKAANEAA